MKARPRYRARSQRSAKRSGKRLQSFQKRGEARESGELHVGATPRIKKNKSLLKLRGSELEEGR